MDAIARAFYKTARSRTMDWRSRRNVAVILVKRQDMNDVKLRMKLKLELGCCSFDCQ